MGNNGNVPLYLSTSKCLYECEADKYNNSGNCVNCNDCKTCTSDGVTCTSCDPNNLLHTFLDLATNRCVDQAALTA